MMKPFLALLKRLMDHVETPGGPCPNAVLLSVENVLVPDEAFTSALHMSIFTSQWETCENFYFDILQVPQKIVHSCEPPKTYETSLRFLTTYLDRRQQMTVFWEIEISDKKGLF